MATSVVQVDEFYHSFHRLWVPVVCPHTSSSLPKPMPLSHLLSAVVMSGISSTRSLGTSCCINDRVRLGSELALDQLSRQTWRSGSSGLGLVLRSQRPRSCTGVKAPEGMPSLRRSAKSSLNGWNGRTEASNFWSGKHSCKSCRIGSISSSVMNGSAWLLAQTFVNPECRLTSRILDVHLLRTFEGVMCFRDCLARWARVSTTISDARTLWKRCFDQERLPKRCVKIEKNCLRYPWFDDINDRRSKSGRVYILLRGNWWKFHLEGLFLGNWIVVCEGICLIEIAYSSMLLQSAKFWTNLAPICWRGNKIARTLL